MSDTMRIQPFDVLLNWMLKELEGNQSIFGIHRSLFYVPKENSPYALDDLFGHYLATPVGPGAGPHTQLAQNIISAWLSGGRFIELKTVQIMDELEIPRPCIDMEDEGYNVEWSQELKLEQSASEYVKAWVLIHVLRRLLGFEGAVPFGTVFNMSVGYDLEGVQSLPMTRFMDRLEDASEEIAETQAILKEGFPQFADIEIPPRLTNNVTLSTMHGCPPDEIERIGRYLLEERGLHTTIKLNPTLLGQEAVKRILHEHIGFREVHIPDAVFEHDLRYERAVALIGSLKEIAARQGLTFGVKLSNTLAMANHKGILPGGEMYMSGRALYPITINLFHKLSQEFSGDLNVSFSAGADALNVTSILAAGAWPVTAVSDVLKPGGYSRFLQYLENLERDMRDLGVASLEELAQDKLVNLEREAAGALDAPRYKKNYHPHGLPKVESKLNLFDCITAPCVAQCAVCQDVPEYAWLISQEKYDQALDVILSRNPLPGVTGYVCPHLCQTRCTRNNYDEPVGIRALKRFAAEQGAREQGSRGAEEQGGTSAPRHLRTSAQVAVIGSGPSGLAAAYFLALNGIQVTVYEAKDRAGGMLALAPTFRLPEAIVREDIDRIKRLGVKIELSHPITAPPEELLGKGFDAVYIGSGAQKDARLGIDGEEEEGVYHALDFLERTRLGERVELGNRVLVIGGGNSAMDAARSARRLTSPLSSPQSWGGRVTVVYRRSRQEMPADDEEVEDALAEGVLLRELVSPAKVILREGQVVGLECIQNELGEVGTDGRRRPVPIAGSEFQIEADAIIVAIGQAPDVSFLDGSGVSLHRNKTIVVDPQTGLAGEERVYAGGDAVRGPATIVEACADGRQAAEAICRQLGVSFDQPAVQLPVLSEEKTVQLKRSRAEKTSRNEAEMLPLEQREGFDLVESTLTEEAALTEASRCMQCASFCDKCVEVCPNRANYTVIVSPMSLKLPVVACQQGRLAVTGEEAFCIEQARQIIHVDDFCNECGNCTTFCVHEGRPYADKPRLFLTESDFEREDDNAFYVEKGRIIRRREGGKESRLSVKSDAGEMVFENELLRMSLSPDFQIKGLELKEEFEGPFSLTEAAEMAVILTGVTSSLSFLPVARRE
ncbi:MAG: putative selenate reductase subunit YgfK [Chloroflexota bacterium]|nr:putative selenate reductase subunit YgfK [Chloroflexota bacterium]